MAERSTWTRDLSEHVDRFGHIAVSVEIGGGPSPLHAWGTPKRSTSASAQPTLVARFLRELADDVERITTTDTGGADVTVGAQWTP